MSAFHSYLRYLFDNSRKHTSGSTGGDNGAVEAGLGDNVDFNGGVTARVIDGASVNLRDRHFEGQADIQSVERKEN
jgi:hypothetical protein